MKNLKTWWKIMHVFGLTLVLFLILLAVSYQGFISLVEARQWVLHSTAVLERIGDIRLDLLQARADKRGLAITGAESFTAPLQEYMARLQAGIQGVKEITADNPRQQEHAAVLQGLYRQWDETDLRPLLAMRREIKGVIRPEDVIRHLSQFEPGRETFEAMRGVLERMRQEEQRLLDDRTRQMESLQDFTRDVLVWGGLATVLLSGLLGAIISRSITGPLNRITASARRVALGDFASPLDIRQRDEVGVLADELRTVQRSLQEKTRVTEAIAAGDLSPSVTPASAQDALGHSINNMIEALRQAKAESERMDWMKTGLNELAVLASGETDPRRLAGRALAFLGAYLDAQIGALYLLTDDGGLRLQGSRAADPDRLPQDLALGQGLAGQAAQERRIVSLAQVPEDYARVTSALGEAPPRSVLALPLTRQGSLVGVAEFGFLEPFSDQILDFLRLAAEPLGVAFDSLAKQARVRELLERTRKQTLQLQEQQEELKSANEELEEHAQTLRRSEEDLKQQREELQAANEELEEKNEVLERQQALIEERNRDLDEARRDVERKAAELEVSGRYKSEFLANMSHELRTPLNSLLLLARSLRDNPSGRLSPDETEAAGIIYKSGNDLLRLINDILDLSKIEAGKMSVTPEDVPLAEVVDSLRLDFRRVAEGKGLDLRAVVEEGLPATVRTDRQRLEQILRNLLSNALKFTEQGEVSLRAGRPEPAAIPLPGGLDPARTVAIAVSDTGLGIPADKRQVVFEAFQQADGSTSRRFGGTGLGLSIVRELTRLLGGEITLASEPGQGSTFTLYLPEEGDPDRAAARPRSEPVRLEAARPRPPAPSQPAPAGERPQVMPAPALRLPDDRDAVLAGDKVILVIEDDPHFAKILLGLCRDKGFKAVAAASGEEGLELAERLAPLGVLLDIRLPGMSGWDVLETLKGDHRTRHIPVHVVSAHESPHDALVMGAVGFLAKPVAGEELERAFERIEAMAEKKVKDLLLVEDSADLRKGILALVGDLGVRVTEAESGRQALEAVRSRRFDCMILDLGLSDMSGFELLKRLEDEGTTAVPPVIVYTGRELTKDEERELRAHAESIIIKGARSEERLLDEVTLFLHRMVSDLPQDKQRMIIDLRNRDAVLEGKTVLLVDDDMRNLFAVSRVLTEKGLKVLKAEDGAAGIALLEAHPETDVVLMDIMMPVMDGYEAMRRIRAQSRFARLPIIALTAKAMKEDREKCLEAGASDYLAKPVDVDKMLSMMRVWLYGRPGGERRT